MSNNLFYGGCKVQLNARVSIATNSKDNKVYIIYIKDNTVTT